MVRLQRRGDLRIERDGVVDGQQLGVAGRDRETTSGRREGDADLGKVASPAARLRDDDVAHQDLGNGDMRVPRQDGIDARYATQLNRFVFTG